MICVIFSRIISNRNLQCGLPTHTHDWHLYPYINTSLGTQIPLEDTHSASTHSHAEQKLTEQVTSLQQLVNGITYHHTLLPLHHSLVSRRGWPNTWAIPSPSCKSGLPAAMYTVTHKRLFFSVYCLLHLALFFVITPPAARTCTSPE